MCGRLIFKTLRILYGSFLFYFMPYATLFIPYVAQIVNLE